MGTKKVMLLSLGGMDCDDLVPNLENHALTRIHVGRWSTHKSAGDRDDPTRSVRGMAQIIKSNIRSITSQTGNGHKT